MSRFARSGLLVGLFACSTLAAVAAQASNTGHTAPTPTHADLLRGNYGEYRANTDLLSYDLDVRVDPAKKFISGSNTIRFKMLADDTRIQIDLELRDALHIDKIVLGKTELKYHQRDSGAVFIDFPAKRLRKGCIPMRSASLLLGQPGPAGSALAA